MIQRFLYQLKTDKDQTIYNDLNMRGYVEAKFLKDFTLTPIWLSMNRLPSAIATTTRFTAQVSLSGVLWGVSMATT